MENHDNQQLSKIFQRRKSFYKDMQSISQRYFGFQQLVYYRPLEDFNSQMIKKVDGNKQIKDNRHKKREDIYIIIGQYQPTGQKSVERLILQLVQTIPRPTSALGFIYINTFADGEAYNDFKKVLELLPIQYLVNLTKIYVLNASFFNKAFSWLSFGVAINYINKKTINVDDLRELSQESHVDIEILKQFLPKNVVRKAYKTEHLARQPKPHGFCAPQYEPLDKPKHIKHQYSSTNIVVESMGRTKSADQPGSQGYHFPPNPNLKLLETYDLGPTGAPVILQVLIYFFNNKEEYLHQEGLFRKSVSIEDQAEILNQLNKKNYNYLEHITNPHIIANAIKRYLCNLSIPIIPYNIFQQFMEKESDPQFKKIVVERIKSLPKVNRMVIFLLFNFLITKVVPHSESSKMGVNNLCIVFGPCLMRSQVASIRDLIYAKKIIVATHAIYTQFQSIFGDKNAQMKIKRNSYKQYRISEMKQRESRDKESPKRQSKESSSSSSEPIKQQEYLPLTPAFQTLTLLNKTSLYIKETLEKAQSQDEFDQIEKEEPIKLLSQDQADIINHSNVIPVNPVNLFISPNVNQTSPIQASEIPSKSQLNGHPINVNGHTQK